MAVHASGRSKHSAVPWRPEMDAFVLLRHVRDGISLPKVAEQWPFESATKRSKDAIKWRWKKVLKRLDALDDLRLICGSCDERDEAETQLSTEISLQPWVEDALVQLHAPRTSHLSCDLMCEACVAQSDGEGLRESFDMGASNLLKIPN